MYQIWTPSHQILTDANQSIYSEKLYLSKQIGCTTNQEEAYEFQTEQEAKDCISWLNHKDQWKIEEYTAPQIKEKEEEDSND